MKMLNFPNQEIEVIYSVKKEMKDSKTNKTIIYYELSVVSSLSESVEVSTSGIDVAKGKYKCDIQVSAKKDNLKMKLLKLELSKGTSKT